MGHIYSFENMHLAPTELIVLQPITLCNLDCEYCALPYRLEKQTLSVSNLKSIFRNLDHDNLLEDKATVCWHLGEPTLLPLQYFQDAISIIRSICPRVDFDFLLQTNGSRLDQRFCRFLAAESIVVGISIDGTPSQNSRRVDRAGGETFDRVMRGIAALQDANVNFYVVAVLSPEALSDAHSFYHFFKLAGIKQLCLQVPESEGGRVSSFLMDDNVFDLLKTFYMDLWAIKQLDSDPIWIREFDSRREDASRQLGNGVIAQEMTAGRIITVLWNGDVLPFTPDFATVPKEDLQRFVIGNLIDQPLSVARNKSNCRFVDAVTAQLVKQCSANCKYYISCGGGNAAHRWAEYHDFEEHQTRTCRAAIQSRLAGINEARKQFNTIATLLKSVSV